MAQNAVGRTINTTMFVMKAGHCPSSNLRAILALHRRIAREQWARVEGPTSKYPPSEEECGG